MFTQSQGMISRSLSGLIPLALLSFSTTLFAGTSDIASQAQPAATPEAWYDKTHEDISHSLDDFANWFDNFFGDPRLETTSDADAYLRLTFDTFLSGVDDESDFSVSASGRVHLPRIKEKLYLVFSNDIDASVTGEDLVDNSPSTLSEKERESGLGLGYLLKNKPNYRIGVSAGLRGGLPPDFYTNLRYRSIHTLSERSRLTWTNTLYWITDDGFGISSLADYEYRTRPDTLWRYTLFGDYSEESNGLEWTTEASWLKRLDMKRAISVRAGLKGETEPEADIIEGWTTFRYRQNFLRPWLFYEIEPGISWHVKEDYDPEPTLSLRLEMHF